MRWQAEENSSVKGVIELCKAADVVFMALHGANGEDGRVQACFDLCSIRIPEPVI